jgi:putative ABC transport system permease protein
MIRTALHGAWAHKRRLAGTALSVVIGVAFLAATLVMGDTARAGFETAFTEANDGIDAVVRSELRLSAGENVALTPIDAAVVDRVAAVDGVATVAPSVEGFAQIVGADGTPLGGEGPPTLGANWIDDPTLTAYDLAEGRAPARPGEVVIDRGSAEAGDLAVGDEVTVLTPAPVTATVVGVATFGDADNLGGTTLAAFSFPEAQRLFVGGAERVTGIVVAGDGNVAQDELAARIAAAVPDGVEAITGAALTAELQDDIESDFLAFFLRGLQVFAGIALLVASISIFNTFSIVAAQRTGEAALLRMLGASRLQVLASGVLEAAVVGVAGVGVGIGAGVLTAAGMLALMESAGFGLPVDGLRVGGGSVVVAAAVGMGVTLVGGFVPAWRASRVPPLAALRDTAVEVVRAPRWRLFAGLALLGAGVALVLSGMSGEGSVDRAGVGSLLAVVAVVLLGPVVAGPAGSLLGAPLRWRGVPGDLARRNVVRNPRRTASTATALLVGVGVVSLFTMFGASVSATIEEAVDEAFGGDLVVEASGFSGAGLSPELLDDVAALDEVGAVAGMGFGPAVVDGDEQQIGFAELADLAAVSSFDVQDGSIGDVGPDGLAVSLGTAEAEGWALGDEVAIRFADGATETFTVAAVYDSLAIGGSMLLPEEAWRTHHGQTSYALAMIGLADGVPVPDGREAVEAVTGPHGSPTVRDRDEFVEAQAGQIDVLLTVVYGLLAVAIVIALMGIGNTLSLSVHERTRELGLLRAVGQTRSQLRAMVRWESVVVAVFGTLGGVGLGLFLGWGLVQSMAAGADVGTFALPAGRLAVIVAVGAAAGVLAGLRPAWRASRLDVLAAVSGQ